MTMPFVKSKTKSAFFLCAVITLFWFPVFSIGKTIEISSLVSFPSLPAYYSCLWFPRSMRMQYIFKIHIVNNSIYASAVTPFIDGGDLQQLWQQTGYFEEDLVRIYVAEMVVTLGTKIKIGHFIFNTRQDSSNFDPSSRFSAQCWNHI